MRIASTGMVAVAATLLLVVPVQTLASEPTATTALIAVSDHSCAVTSVGHAACWGDNSAGGLGDGTTHASGTPVDVVGLPDAVLAVATGDRYSCALGANGGVACWGYNEFGQLGDGTTTDRATPVGVTDLGTGVRAIAARGEHTCALITDRMKCWGANVNGQLGDGTRTNRRVAVDVEGVGEGVVSMATGGEHTCAITTGGRLRCWGWNKTGQLGDGTTVDRSLPTDVIGLTDGVIGVGTGGRHTCAMSTGGDVRCWGFNKFGQLGDGTTTDRSSPVAVNGLGNRAIAVAVGGNFTCALLDGGDVVCWGDDSAGQLGDGLSTSQAAPVPVVGLTGAAAIAAGFYHACAIRADGAITCWGSNEGGQLGGPPAGGESNTVDVRNADGTRLLTTASAQAAKRDPVPAIVAIALAAVLAAAVAAVVARRRRSGPATG